MRCELACSEEEPLTLSPEPQFRARLFPNTSNLAKLFHAESCAGVAQRQSGAFVMLRSGVQIPAPAPYLQSSTNLTSIVSVSKMATVALPVSHPQTSPGLTIKQPLLALLMSGLWV